MFGFLCRLSKTLPVTSIQGVNSQITSSIYLHVQRKSEFCKNLQEESSDAANNESESGRVAASSVVGDLGGRSGGLGASAGSGIGVGGSSRVAGLHAGLGSTSALGGRGRARVLGGRGAGVVVLAALDLDAAPAASLVTVAVGLDIAGGRAAAAGVVDNLDALVVGVEWGLGEVGQAASPVTGTRRRVGATSAPGANLDLHGGLGELGASSGGSEGADSGAVDDPVNSILGPLNGVGVVGAQRAANGVGATTVVGGGVALGEVVGLDVAIVTTNPLPVDLIEVIRLEDSRGNNTVTLGSLDLNVDAAEEDVVLGSGGGSVADLLDGEDGALVVVLGGGAVEVVEGRALALGEVAVDRVLAKGRVGRAGYCGLAVDLRGKTRGPRPNRRR